MTPLLLDLFSGAGGCARGYQQAGFKTIGVDKVPQPRYAGDEFHQADALAVLQFLNAGNEWQGHVLTDFAAIHASPPCQAYSSMGQKHAATQASHPMLIVPLRGLLAASGLPYVIENVVGARDALDHPVLLCGRALGMGVARHRLFECSFPTFATQCACRGDELPIYGKLDGRRLWTRTDGSELRAAKTLTQASIVMGIHWMEWSELTQAIPPAYTEHVGGYLMAEIRARAKAAA